ncbi:MAG: anti-sigma factor C-terminal domain-containing protein [Anaerotignum sp.]|nr:anti-sigma factor C-terminal domain-containing protein [Anaerotignum sp.]
MTFRERLERYQNGVATEEEQRQIEQELEKYDALTEYFLAEAMPEQETEPEQTAELQKIRRRMKWRTVGMIGATVAISCGLIGGSWHFQPVISKALWFDPTKAEMQEFAYDIDCDIAVMTELLMPEVQMESVRVTERGWGRYDVAVQRQDWSTGRCDYVQGSIKRNEMEMDHNFYTPCVMNIFSRGDMLNESKPEPNGVVIDTETAKAALEDLPEYIRMEAYISLGRDWDMAELADFWQAAATETGNLGWVAVRSGPLEVQQLPLIGFQASGSGLIWEDLDARYPYYEISLHEKEPLATVWAAHFKALLQYSIDHGQWRQWQRKQGVHFAWEEILDYVEQNGVKTYGFVYYGTPRDLLQVLEDADVEGIHVSDYSVDVPDLS